jgi:phosphomannomutase / phosphoglucomutase
VSIFKACDIRGVAESELNDQIVRKIGRALGMMALRSGSGRVCLAGDFRRSTPALKQAVCAGLIESGAVVLDAGQVPTPIAYFIAARRDCGNVAIVTASHNAGRYNGVKFMVAGQPAVPELIGQLQALLDVSPNRAAAMLAPAATPGAIHRGNAAGRVEPVDLLADYETAVRATAAELASGVPSPPAPLPKRERGERICRRLTIAVDPMAGALAEIAPRVLEAAGCRVVPLRAAIDPDFSDHDPNPAVDANLAELTKRVVTEQADFGVALDGDGDRVALVDSAGRIVRPEQVGAMLVQRCFPRPMVVYDLKCASVLAEAVRAAGGTSIIQPSGHGFIKTAMIRRHADLGVEVSGHYFYRALAGGDDGLFTALVVAHVVAQSGRSLAELIEPIGWPAVTPDLRLPLPGDAAEILERIAAHCGGEVSRLDGVRAQYDDGWALARISITEPLVTLRFEANVRSARVSRPRRAGDRRSPDVPGDLRSAECRGRETATLRERAALREIAARFLKSVPTLSKQVLEMIR